MKQWFQYHGHKCEQQYPKDSLHQDDWCSSFSSALSHKPLLRPKEIKIKVEEINHRGKSITVGDFEESGIAKVVSAVDYKVSGGFQITWSKNWLFQTCWQTHSKRSFETALQEVGRECKK